MISVYAYKNCDTCRKALKWLEAEGIAHEVRPIRETPPTHEELAAALTALSGELRRLFNTAGADYREMNLKDRLPTMAAEEAFDLLHGNGNLVKRPFVIGDGVVLVGFKEREWREALL